MWLDWISNKIRNLTRDLKGPKNQKEHQSDDMSVTRSSSKLHPGPSSESSEPLVLTPLLEQGRIKEAQKASRVHVQGFAKIISYSGFFTVDKDFKSNLFFWFFPAANGDKRAPVLLWLSGGPGLSSLQGLFTQNGPFSVGQDFRLKKRSFSWTSTYSVIYIDSPVGAGYSFTDPGGFSTNGYHVGSNLYKALLQFFTMFPHLRSNQFFVIGESYSGKFVTSLCYTIHERNPEAKLKINLHGFAIGNGFIDPLNMMNYGDFLYQIGLLDAAGRRFFEYYEDEVVENIEEKNWRNALDLYARLIGINNDSIFNQLTGYLTYNNYLYEKNYLARQMGDLEKYLSTATLRKMLHVGNANPNIKLLNVDVGNNLVNDIMQSVKPQFEILLEHYRVLLYSGQLDIIVNTPLTRAFIDKLQWSGAEDYRRAPRNPWRVEGALAGYSKAIENFAFVEVRLAGHQVPIDQPEWALDMMTKFIQNEPYQV